MSEAHRNKAIRALMAARPSGFFGEQLPESLLRELATEIVDHITAHAVETARDLLRAEAKRR